MNRSKQKVISFQNVIVFFFFSRFFYLLTAEAKEGCGQKCITSTESPDENIANTGELLVWTIFKTPDVHMVPTSQ